jgi:uncharacterized protein (UPF0276 family)
MAASRLSLGHGIGLRTAHYAQLLEGGAARADWMEAISENFFALGARPFRVLERVRRDVPVALHGVSLGVGNAEPPGREYLDALAALVAAIQPVLVTDHLCWGALGGHYAHDLWPLPFTEEAVAHVAARVRAVQDRLGRRVALENPASYVAFRGAEMSEWDFVSEVARRADCGLLLDLNNVIVSAKNNGFDPGAYVDGLAHERVAQIHLAGHSDCGDYLFDTHTGPVPGAVWDLYRLALRRCGRVPTLVEWDTDVPDYETLLREADRARTVEQEELGDAR